MGTRSRQHTIKRKHRPEPLPAITPESYLAGHPMCETCGVNEPMQTTDGKRLKLCVGCYERA